MVRFFLCVALTTLASGPAFAESVPFAVAPELRPTSNNAYVPSLGEIMQIVQFKHIKLWQAGSALNWHLAAFEVDQIRDTFLRTAMFYEGIPTNYVVAVEEPLSRMKQAARTGDSPSYESGYAKLTEACNACHRAAKVGFIVIRTPTSSPFADQKF